MVENLHHVDPTDIVKLDVLVVALCLDGEASLSINGQVFNIKANDLLICPPNILLENATSSGDLDFRCMSFSRDYFRQMSMAGSGNPWDVMKFLENSPVLQLEPEEVKVFCQYYDLICSKLQGTPRRHQKELIHALLQAFHYEFRDLLERFNDWKPQAYSAGERVFREFLDLLSTSFPKPRSVSAYADKLCITPKYLSTVAKQVGGESASALINRYVIQDIEYMLKQPDKSIKEICNELDFPNLSFFGKYVRRHLGISPKAYREKHLQK